MTDEERAAMNARAENRFVDRVRSAEAIIEVEALTSSGPNSSHAIFKVVKVYQGEMREGSKRKLQTLGGSLCGPGGAQRGDRGIIYLSKDEPNFFNGFLNQRTLTLLREKEVLP